MKPIRRRVRRHFGLTAKQVAVRTHRPWYVHVFLVFMFIAIGFGLAYWILFDEDVEKIKRDLETAKLENNSLGTKLVKTQRELQVELATNNNLAKELASVQDEGLKCKEDLLFYKNMLNGKKSR